MRLASSLFAPDQLTNSEKVVQDGQKAMAIITVTASHVLICSLLHLLEKQFDRPPGLTFESFRSS
jgi:hypothetical protein